MREHEDTALLQFIGCVARADCEEACNCSWLALSQECEGAWLRTDVGWDGHELTLLVGVAHVFDDAVVHVSSRTMEVQDVTAYVGRNNEIEYNGV